MRAVLASLVNFRDLGGARTASGRAVATGRLFRSDALTHLSDEDRDHLRDTLGVCTVVDLRAPIEHDRLGRYDGTWLGLDVHELPILDGAVLRAHAARGNLPMREMYRMIVDDGAATLRTAVALLAEPTRLPAVVACSGGKDRTGVVVAVVLTALGVPRHEILADYYRSAPALEALRERVASRMAGNGVVIPPDAFTIDGDALDAALDTVAPSPAAVDAYLGADLVAGLRHTLLDPA